MIRNLSKNISKMIVGNSVYLILLLFFACSCNKDTCKQEPQNLSCLDVWIPVCGCDGITYSNDCYAYSAGVMDFTQGTCD